MLAPIRSDLLPACSQAATASWPDLLGGGQAASAECYLWQRLLRESTTALSHCTSGKASRLTMRLITENQHTSRVNPNWYRRPLTVAQSS